MRRGWRLASLVLVLALVPVGSGSAQERSADPAIRGRLVTPTRTGLVDMDKAVEWDLMLGLPFRDEISRRAPRPPRWLPEMPLPKGSEPPPGPDWTPEASLSEMPFAPLPLPSGSFAGLGDNNTAIPPDTHGAVGPTKVMTTLNTQVQVQTRTGALFSGPVTLGSFWAGVATSGVFDPRVYFDPDPAYGGRWIWVAVQGADSPSSGLLVAASNDAEPVRGPGALFDADGTNAVWADYPTVGFNRNWVVVQVNMFGGAPTYSFARSQVYVFRKDQLYAGTLAPFVFSLATACEGASNCGGTQVPALTYDFGENDLYLLQRWNSGAGALRLYRISGPVGGPTITPLVPLVFGAPWADREPTNTGADFAPQPPACGGDRIQTNDSRVQNVVFRNGRIWATHTVFLPVPADGTPDRASVQWWEILPDSSVVQRGRLDDPTVGGTFFAFPSIAVNRNDDVLLGYSSFSPNEFASAQYTFRLAGDPANTMQQPVLLKAGEACYFKDFATGQNRWGDFSATVVDPVDDTTMWTLQEYAETPVVVDRWGTWWGAVGPPAISIADASMAEGNAGTTFLTFDLTLSGQTSETVTVQWATADDTATDLDDDYEPAGGTVTFPPLAATATVQVPVNGDTKHEPSERFFVNLSSPQYATLGDPQAVGTIANDEPDPQISIGDVQVVEGDSGFTNAVFTVTLSYPSSGTVSATWATAPGTATSPADFVTASGVVSFDPGVVTQTVTVLVVGDTANEPDETFTVALSGALAGTLLKSVGNGLILNDDSVQYEPVYGLVVVSDGDSSVGRNRLQWLNPTPAPLGIRINFTHGPTSCPPPTGPGPGAWGAARPDGWDVDYGGSPAQTSPHASLILNEKYCYGVWAWYGASNWSARVTATGVPFDATGKVKWKYFIGLTTLAHPTVGTDAVLAPSNDFYVHAMTPGPSPAGGGWPAGWVPVNLGSPAQARSPIVPLGGVSRAFYTTQDGWVHAINAATGERLWDVRIGTTSTSGQAAPAGIFADFGGGWDYLLVGTRMDAGNKFYALDPVTGGVIDVFPQGTESGVSGIGMINGMAAIDYPGRRVYFGSLPGTAPDAPETLWCLQLGPPSNALSLAWRSGAPGPIEGSPVLRGTRLYVGDMDGKVWSVQLDGTNAYSLDLGDGAVKGFPFPDRRNLDLFVATSTKVFGLTDTVGTSLGYKWTNPVQGLDNPSVVLLKPGTNELYVGVRDIGPAGGPDWAGLIRIDTSLSDPGPSATAVELEDAAAIVGPPSLDIRFTPNIIYVGSVNGVVYAVEASF